ncbi:phosphotransferase [Paenibacillus sp. y28]|uniref:phosphotransferase n=1 Tax=Paenibacillus sp. y28 TaxID=3129110 RepID=UPI003017D1B5
MKELEDAIRRLLEPVLPGTDFIIRTGPSGRNNTTRFIDTAQGTLVLRIYNTHRDESKVRYEHAILLELASQRISLQTPVPVLLPDGGTILYLDGGETPGEERPPQLAALFHYIEGRNPELRAEAEFADFGRATGLISNTLARIQTEAEPSYRPYYEIEHAHPGCPPELALRFCQEPPQPFMPLQRQLERIGSQLDSLITRLPELAQLPHQLVHGDLNVSNILAGERGGITAFIDFEFVTRDIRVMELAVCLSDLIRDEPDQEQRWTGIAAFLTGYRQFVSLEAREIEALPLLLRLRRLDVFVHFLGRYMEKVDPPEVLADMTARCAQQLEWLISHERELDELCRYHLL